MAATHEYYNLRTHTIQVVRSGNYYVAILYDLQEPEPKVLSSDVFDTLREASARATSLLMDKARLEHAMETETHN